MEFSEFVAKILESEEIIELHPYQKEIIKQIEGKGDIKFIWRPFRQQGLYSLKTLQKLLYDNFGFIFK